MRETVNTYLGLASKVGVVLLILSTLFLFTNLTTDFYETPKFLILAIFTLILLVLLSLKFTLAGRVVLNRTPLDIPLLLLLAVGIVSTMLSSSPYVATLGNQLRIHGSLVALITYVLFYFVLVNNLKSAKEIRRLLYLLVISAQFLAAVTLMAYFGLRILPEPWTQGVNFAPTGSSFSTTAILALLLPFVIVPILSENKLAVKILNGLFLVLMGVTIVLTGSFATWIAALLGLVLSFVAISPVRAISKMGLISLAGLIIPLVIVGLMAALSYIPPVGETDNPLYEKAKAFPREMQLPFVTSWKVSVSAFRDSPFWGTGPSTYLFDFTNYKPIEFNSSPVWNLRFDSAFNEYLQVLATLGGVGLVALLSLTALFITSAYQTYSSRRADLSYLPLALSISGLGFFVILALHPGTLPVWIIGLIVLACFMALNTFYGEQRSWSAGKDIKNLFLSASTETIKIDALPSVLLIVVACLALFASFFGGKLTLADYHHRKALNAVSQNQGLVAYNELVAAEKLNPWSDLYRTDLAQTNFALANAIAAAKGPTDASPSGSLTDQDKQNIQVLIQQSINEARTAVTLSPRSAINWEILALLYRQIAGVAQNALLFSLDSYGRAIQNDPLNPILRVNVGGVYYAVQNYDLAIRFFIDSINLKPDFANGYYNLSVALRDKGDLNGAVTTAEKVLTLVEVSSPDYKIATDYLNELKSKAGGGPAQPPAATSSGALQKEELPDVVNVGKPEKIATPSAVKKPNSTPEPSPIP